MAVLESMDDQLVTCRMINNRGGGGRHRVRSTSIRNTTNQLSQHEPATRHLSLGARRSWPTSVKQRRPTPHQPLRGEAPPQCGALARASARERLRERCCTPPTSIGLRPRRGGRSHTTDQPGKEQAGPALQAAGTNVVEAEEHCHQELQRGAGRTPLCGACRAPDSRISNCAKSLVTCHGLPRSREASLQSKAGMRWLDAVLAERARAKLTWIPRNRAAFDGPALAPVAMQRPA